MLNLATMGRSSHSAPAAGVGMTLAHTAGTVHRLYSRSMHTAATPVLQVSSSPHGSVLHFSGPLDVRGVPAVWDAALEALRRAADAPVVVDASGVQHLDGAGIALLLDLLRQPRAAGAEVRIEGLPARYRAMLDQFDPANFRERERRAAPSRGVREQLGQGSMAAVSGGLEALAFVGETAAALVEAVRKPRSLRWRDALLAAQRVGADALPIVSLVAFLMGLILAFQAAVAMRQFGAEILVADLVGISLVRELAPLMTAILLAGRSGAAFAAEIGTMRVNEEVDALVTMGLDPVRFLVVPRMLAALAMTPLLTLYANLVGLLGGAAVMATFEIPLAAYMRETFAFVTPSDFLGGMAKTFVFGAIVAGVGCLRGLQTRVGAEAVGLAATRAVVTSIVLIVVADGVFAVVYYHLGI